MIRDMIVAIRADVWPGGRRPTSRPGSGPGESHWTTVLPTSSASSLIPTPPVTTSYPSTSSSVEPATEHTSTSAVGVPFSVSTWPSFYTSRPWPTPLAFTDSATQPSASFTSSGTLVTALPSDMPPSSSSPTATGSLKQTDSSSNDTSSLGSNRTLVITLSTVLSAVGSLLLVGALLICLKFRKRRVPFLTRGISPIDDDEIATWKASRDEKAALADRGAEAGVTASPPRASKGPSYGMHTSTGSIKKPAGVIIYQGRNSQQLPRRSGEGSPRSIKHNTYGHNVKTSLDKELPHTPIQAVAPNARAGLTDEAVPGADPFLPSPKRHPSRLSKAHPNVTSPRSAHMHTRTRSSRSSTRSFGGDYGYYTSSDMELSPRTSNDYYSNLHNGRGRSRVYSSSSVPPRLSLGDEGAIGGLSPRPLFRESDMIGRAIG